MLDAGYTHLPYRLKFPDYAESHILPDGYLAPSFWASMSEKIQDGSIAILDLVKKEILQPSEKDDLALWMSNLKIGRYINHSNKR